MPNKQIHTVWNKEEKRWDNKKPNAQRISSHAETKAEAMGKAINQAKREKLEHVPHKKNGKIQNPNSYGNDPFPPKDKKH